MHPDVQPDTLILTLRSALLMLVNHVSSVRVAEGQVESTLHAAAGGVNTAARSAAVVAPRVCFSSLYFVFLLRALSYACGIQKMCLSDGYFRILHSML